VLDCSSGGCSSSDIHALFFFDLAGFILRFAFEKVFPPLSDGKDSVYAL
jgi:hypothetical protein